MGGDLREHRLGSEGRQERKAANAECIIQQVPLWQLGLTCGAEDTPHLSQLRGREMGIDAPTHCPARGTLWPIRPTLLTGSEQVFGVRDDATKIALPYRQTIKHYFW